jgi:hypothetical protein
MTVIKGMKALMDSRTNAGMRKSQALLLMSQDLKRASGVGVFDRLDADQSM